MGSVAYGSKIYFAGGDNLAEDTRKVEIYDVITGEWAAEEFSIPREFPAVGAAGGKVLFAGGINFYTLEHYSRVDIFDTLTHAWATAELPEQKFDVAAISYGGRIFFAGGVNIITGNNSSAVDIYNTTTGEWTAASLSEPGGVRAVAVGPKLYFVGAAVMDIYDTATDSWTALGLPDIRPFAGVAAVGNQILIAGGMNLDNTPSSRVDIYDLSTGNWAIANLSLPRAFINNAATVCGKAFFAGGGNFDLSCGCWINATNVVDIYDSATGEWTIGHITHPVVNHSVIASGNHLLVAGGGDPANLTTIFSTVDIYTCPNASPQVWEIQYPNYPAGQDLFGLVASVVDENVAWTAAEGGTCDTYPWNFNLSQNRFSRTTDGGQTWTSGTYPTTVGASIVTSIFAFDENIAWLTVADFAAGNHVLKTTDGGHSWTEMNVPVTVYPDFIHFFDNAFGVVVGDPDSLGFQIFWSATGGAGWQRVNPGLVPAALPGEFTFPFYAQQGDNIWFTTQYGRIFHSFTKGATWELWERPIEGFPDAIACKDNTCVLAFGDYSDTQTHINKFHLYRTTDRGQNWTDITPLDNHFATWQLQFVPNSGVLIGAFHTHNIFGPFQTWVSYDDGTTWEVIDEGTKILTLFFHDETTGYATHMNSAGEPLRIFRYIGEPLISALPEHKPPRAEVLLSPNPTDGIVAITINGQQNKGFLLTVSDVHGRVLQSQKLENPVAPEQTLDLSGLPAGVYLVGLSNEAGRFCSKVIKQ